MNKQIDYFVRGYTGLGEVNYINSNVNNINNVYILKAANEKTATLFLKEFITLMRDETSVEIIHHPDYAHALDGVIIRDKSLAILTTPFIKYISSHSHLIDLTKYTKLPVRFIAQNRQNIIEKTIHYFSESLEIHKKIKKINKKTMNFQQVDKTIEQFIDEKISVYPDLNQETHIYERMFGTNTEERIVDCVDSLIAPLNNRVYLKGAPGTGKSYFMKEVMEEVIKKGYDIEVYRCSFDSHSIDMLIIRGMDYCLFDSSSPHEYDPSEENDYIINLSNKTEVLEKTEENNSSLSELTKNYDQLFKLGLEEFEKLQAYAGSIDKSEIELTQSIVKRILKDYRVNY